MRMSSTLMNHYLYPAIKCLRLFEMAITYTGNCHSVFCGGQHNSSSGFFQFDRENLLRDQMCRLDVIIAVHWSWMHSFAITENFFSVFCLLYDSQRPVWGRGKEEGGRRKEEREKKKKESRRWRITLNRFW